MFVMSLGWVLGMHLTIYYARLLFPLDVFDKLCAVLAVKGCFSCPWGVCIYSYPSTRVEDSHDVVMQSCFHRVFTESSWNDMVERCSQGHHILIGAGPLPEWTSRGLDRHAGCFSLASRPHSCGVHSGNA